MSSWTPSSTSTRICATSTDIFDRALDARRGDACLTQIPLARLHESSGKVREMYGARRRPPADGGLRPDLGLRRRAADADPGQGPGADGHLRASGSSRPRGIVPNHLISADRATFPGEAGAAPDLRRPVDARAPADDAAGRVHRARLPRRLGLEGLRRTGAVCGIALPPGLREAERLPEPIFTPSTKADRGPRREHRRRRAGSTWSARSALERLERTRRSTLYTYAAEHAREPAGIILADTKFEFGLDDDGELRADRRGADARLVALLAGRRLRARRRASRASTSSTCATGCATPAGTRRRPAPELPAEVVEGTAARYVEAYERITGEPFDALPERHGT